jgi:parallel beta-helix repeat protein
MFAVSSNFQLAALKVAAQPSSGNWVVFSTEIVENEKVILTGNLTIEPGGNLTLRNVTLTLAPQYDGQYGISAESGSSLSIYDSNISSATSFRLFFSVDNASFTIKDSKLSMIGGETDGLSIIADNAVLERVFINDSNGVLLDSHWSKIINCTFSHTLYAIWDSSSAGRELPPQDAQFSNPSNNLILGNTISETSDDGAINLSDEHDNVIANNTIIDAMETSIRMGGCYNNLIANNHILLEHWVWPMDWWAAITIGDFSFNNTVSGNTVYYNTSLEEKEPIAGIMLQYASYNHVQNNTILGAQQSVFVQYSYDNSIVYNKISNIPYLDPGINWWTPTCDAIQLYHSSGNFIAGNDLSSVGSNAILVWENSTNNTIQSNLINQSYDGIMLHYSSDNNTVVNNIVKGIASWDIALDESSRNMVYDNGFEGNLVKSLDSGANSWNSSVVGNYWGDYSGNVSNNDEIGDIPYKIPPNGTDYLPLMKPPSIQPFIVPTTSKIDPFLIGATRGYMEQLVVSGNETWKDTTLSNVAVYVTSEANLTLENVTLELGLGYWLYLQAGASLYIYNSTITSAMPMFGGYQIRAEDPRVLVVKNSIIEYSGGGYAADWGTIVSGNWGNVTSSVTVENNLFKHDYTALDFFGPGTIRALNNTIEYGYCGLFVLNGYASDNRISNMIYAGLYGFGGASGPPQFENNTVSNCWGAGILLGSPPETPVKYNTITDCEEGIRISSGGSPSGGVLNNATVSENTITGSIGWALHIKVRENDDATILVSNNTIKDNGRGIYLEPGTHGVTIHHNYVINSPNSTDLGCPLEMPVAYAGSNRTADVGETVNFDASRSSGNVSIVSYEWSFGDGTTGTGETTSHIYTSPGTYTVTLTVKDALNAIGTNTATITVNTALSVTISPGSAVLHVGQPQTFNATASFGTMPYSYQWYLNSTTVSGATNASWTFTSVITGSYSISAVVTDATGEVATSTASTVTVTPIPEFPTPIPLILILVIVSALFLMLTKRRKPINT